MPHRRPDHLEIDDVRRDVLRRHAEVIAGGAHPDVPVTPAHVYRPPSDLTAAQGLGVLAAMALVLLSGLAAGHLIDMLGVRLAAFMLLGLATGATAGLGSVAIGGAAILPATQRLLLIGTIAVAIATGSRVAIALVPAIVHAAVARILFASLEDETTLIEKGARLSHPLAPSFIAPYCRKLTAVWAGLFAASAVATTLLAITGHEAAHRAWTGWIFWTMLGVFSFFEFFWRKAWFRYYGPGPLDRLLARVFPPQNTARGRRSEAYVRSMRSELARLAEASRSGASSNEAA